MGLKFIISLSLFSLLIKTVISEVTAYAHASSHSSSGFKHQVKGKLNLTERMEELKAHINAMKEKHLKHRMEMLNKHKFSSPKKNNQHHRRPSNPHKELSEFHVVEPVTTQAASTYLINSIQTKEPVTEQLISTSTEQIFYSPEVEKSYNNVEKPKDISTTSTIMPTEESTTPMVTVTLTEKSTTAIPTITVTKDFTPTVTVTEESTMANTVVTVPLTESTVGEISESTTTDSYSMINFTNTDPEKEIAAHDFSNFSVGPANNNDDSSYDDFDIDIRDGEIGE